jgi:hypothetical protein
MVRAYCWLCGIGLLNRKTLIMNMVKITSAGSGILRVCLVMAIGLVCSLRADAALEERFDVLEIGTQTYHNVTVTTKNKKYIFFMHSGGMSNVKVSDLPQDLRDKLGYTAAEAAEAARVQTNSLSAWARQTLKKMEFEPIRKLEASFAGTSGGKIDFSSRPVLMALAVTGLIYLLFCYCGVLICRKAGNEAGPLIWLPVLQIFPFLRAARMKPGWFFAFLVPVINVIALIVWAVNIAQARGKSGWVAFCLVLPLTNVLAYAYLAFSAMPRKPKPAPRVELMTLETA